MLARASDRWQVKGKVDEWSMWRGGHRNRRVYALMLTLATTQTDNAQKTHGAGFLAVSKAQLLTEHHHPSPTAV